MTQVCLDGLDVIACIEGCDGEGVSEVVEVGFVHTGTLGDFLKCFKKVRRTRCFPMGKGSAKSRRDYLAILNKIFWLKWVENGGIIQVAAGLG